MARRLARENLDRLFDAPGATNTSAGAGDSRVMSALYGLLGFDGQPVTAARLAAALDWDKPRSQQLLDGLSNVELDEHGSVIGFGGLTLRPTPHQLVVAGQVRYAWCAWDALFLPVALGAGVDVRSHCPQTGRPISLKVAPTGVVERDPDSRAFIRPPGRRRPQ